MASDAHQALPVRVERHQLPAQDPVRPRHAQQGARSGGLAGVPAAANPFVVPVGLDARPGTAEVVGALSASLSSRAGESSAGGQSMSSTYWEHARQHGQHARQLEIPAVSRDWIK